MVKPCVSLFVLTPKSPVWELTSFISLERGGFSQESWIRISAMGFIHLHVHSNYSFLDGASSPDQLLEKAKALGMPAIALTDHNRLTGAIRFYDRAIALGI